MSKQPTMDERLLPKKLQLVSYVVDKRIVYFLTFKEVTFKQQVPVIYCTNSIQFSFNLLAITCLDTDVINCPKWAIQGECENNPWMMDNCKKSCGVCGKSYVAHYPIFNRLLSVIIFLCARDLYDWLILEHLLPQPCPFSFHLTSYFRDSINL